MVFNLHDILWLDLSNTVYKTVWKNPDPTKKKKQHNNTVW